MKASTAIRNATKHQMAAKDLLAPFSDLLATILEDDCAHISYNAGDGYVVSYRGGFNNTGIAMLDIDKLLKMDKEEMLAELDQAGLRPHNPRIQRVMNEVRNPMELVVSTELRAMLVNKRDYIKNLLPSTRQVKLIMLIRKRKRVTSIDISHRLDISLQNATQQLKKLYDLGYLCREDVGDPSGGSLYEYWCDLEC